MFFLLSAILSLSSCFASEPSFSYWIDAHEEGYLIRTEMVFSPGIDLNQVIANLTDGQLFHEFYSNMAPVQILNRVQTPSGWSYDQVLSVRTYGFRTDLLSHCTENIERNSHRPSKLGSDVESASEWRRHCHLSLSSHDGATYMQRKSDFMSCATDPNSRQVKCSQIVTGRLKKVLWISAAVLTVKAKVQALRNWGRFWFYTESGSISAQYSNPLFDRSKLNQDIQRFLERGLKAARSSQSFQIHEEGQN